MVLEGMLTMIFHVMFADTLDSIKIWPLSFDIAITIH